MINDSLGPVKYENYITDALAFIIMKATEPDKKHKFLKRALTWNSTIIFILQLIRYTF